MGEIEGLQPLLLIVGLGLLTGSLASGQTNGVTACADLRVLLSQPPLSIQGGVSSNSVSADASAAENFVLTSDALITRIVFWGFNSSSTPAAEPEEFVVIFRRDDAGEPSFDDFGPTLPTVVPVRDSFQFQGGAVNRYVADVEPIGLLSGTHWIQIYAISGGAAPGGSATIGVSPRGIPIGGVPNFVWQFGTLGSQRGIAGAAFGTQGFLGGHIPEDLALEVCGPFQQSDSPPGIPALDHKGLAALALALMCAAAAAIRLRSSR